MAVVTLKDTLKPWKDMVADIFLTFKPYPRDWGLEPLPNLNFIFADDETDRKEYLDGSIWGDLTQLPRGLVNAGKGVLRILRGAIKLVPPLFLIWCVYKMLTENDYLENLEPDNYYDPSYSPSFWLAFKGELKGLGYDFVNGIGILLRGILQVATTPLLIFRIPIRCFIPDRNKIEFETDDKDEIQYGKNSETPTDYPVTHTTSPVSQPTDKRTYSPNDSDEENNLGTTHTTGYGYTNYSSGDES